MLLLLLRYLRAQWWPVTPVSRLPGTMATRIGHHTYTPTLLSQPQQILTRIFYNTDLRGLFTKTFLLQQRHSWGESWPVLQWITRCGCHEKSLIKRLGFDQCCGCGGYCNLYCLLGQSYWCDNTLFTLSALLTQTHTRLNPAPACKPRILYSNHFKRKFTSQ